MSAIMTITPTSFADAKLIKPDPHQDTRGLFMETFVASKYKLLGIPDLFVQDSISVSTRGVLRGLHADAEMSKLVQVLCGEAFDVIVDARICSETFGKWQGFSLSDKNRLQLYVPPGFLHGFLALSKEVLFSYKQSAEYEPERELAVVWNDPDLGIEWPLHGLPIVSAKDQSNLRFKDAFALGH